MLVSLTLLPAVLSIVGHRIERGAIRKRRDPNADIEQSVWGRLARLVMRNPGIVLVVVLGSVVLVALPAGGAKLEIPNVNALPRHVESRVAMRDIEHDFQRKVSSPIMVVLHSDDEKQIGAFEREAAKVTNVAQVTEHATQGGRTLLTVTTKTDIQGGPDARRTVRALRGLDQSGAHPTLEVGGQFAWEQEFFDVMKSGMPLTLLIVFGSSFLVLMVAFRSIIVPIKAIVLDALSIAATLGIVVLVFQGGHGIGLLGAEATGWVEASLPLMLFCLLFGLSMDYEVFMLASVAEEWQDGADTVDATARGIARTAPLVTGAAMILVVLGAAFATTELVLVKQIGFGVAVALLLDATVVRALLVPATMRLLGDRQWWIPDWLARRLPVGRWA